MDEDQTQADQTPTTPAEGVASPTPAPEVAELRRQLTELQQSYQQNWQTMTHLLAQARQPAPAATDESSDDEPVEGLTKSQLTKLVHDAQAQGLSPMLSTYYRDQRQINRQLAQQRLSDFSKYAAEIDQLLDQQDAAIAARPDAYDAAWKAVRALHFDEIVKAEVDRRQQEPAPTTTPTASAPPAPRPEAPVPVGSASGPGARTTPRRQPDLSQDEERWAKRFGLTSEEYDRFSDDQYSVDVLGLRDAKGNLRSRV